MKMVGFFDVEGRDWILGLRWELTKAEVCSLIKGHGNENSRRMRRRNPGIKCESTVEKIGQQRRERVCRDRRKMVEMDRERQT